jgi:hypothetical protein
MYFFDGENISFDASLVIYITNIPPIMIINRIYDIKMCCRCSFFSFLLGLKTYQHPCTRYESLIVSGSPPRKKCAAGAASGDNERLRQRRQKVLLF